MWAYKSVLCFQMSQGVVGGGGTTTFCQAQQLKNMIKHREHMKYLKM